MNLALLALLTVLGLPSLSQDPESPRTDDVDAAAVARLQARYAGVEEELARADVSCWSVAQLEARARVLAFLHDYRERGDFGHDHEHPGARVPYFVDHGGRRCAVAELLHRTGEDELVETVRRRTNHAWVVDLAKDETFLGWLDRNGLSLWEAARIQVPAIDGGPPGGPQDRIDPNSGGSGSRGSGYNGPGDTTSGRAGASSAPAGPAPATNNPSGAAPRPSTSAPTAPRTPGLPTALNLTTESDDGWWLWWEYNKLEFLRPNRLEDWAFPATGDDSGVDRTRAVRRELLPDIEEALGDPDATVRGAAALALGRVGRGGAVEDLLGALEDPSVQVRHRAILALGSTGAPEAIDPLLAIARTGSVKSGSVERISPFASPLAIVALALGRRVGFDETVGPVVASIAASRKGADSDAVRIAACIFHKLSPCAELEKLALDTALDATWSPSVRCRAVESLSSSGEDRTVSRIQTLLSGSRLDLRRSAALALGDSRHPLALPPLMTAFETEAEPLTKGLILISIGRQGGDKAKEFLLGVLKGRETGARKWAALGLGLVARASEDATVGESIGAAIREASERERNREAAAAYWIASGLARDAAARPGIRQGLWRAADPRMRMYAATALSLIGGEPSARALRERLPEESSALARVAIAQSLGTLGLPEDSPLLSDVLVTLREPALQGLGATAISFHGSVEGFHALRELAKSDDGSRVRRAAAIEGLGMQLGGSPPLVLGEASRQSNYTVFTDWVKEMLQTTL